MLSFCYLKIIHFPHPHYHQKKVGDVLKNVQKATEAATGGAL